MWKRVCILFALALILASGAGCGKEEVQQEPVDKPLSGSVDLVVLPGVGEIFAEFLPDEFDVTVFQDLKLAEGSVVSGSWDMAILPANTAAYLYNRTGGSLSAVSPVSLGGWSILSNGAYIPEENLYYLRGRTIVAWGEGGTGVYVLRKLLLENGINPDTRIRMKWVDTPSEALEALSQRGTIALLQEPFATRALGTEGVERSISLDKLWKEMYNVPIPSEVLVVSPEFAGARGEEMAAVRKAFSAALAESERSIPGMVFYPDSNRGMVLLRGYLERMAESWPEAVGGKLPGPSFYLGIGE